MHATFVKLFLSFRKLGSNFWLAFCVLVTSIFAFILALPIANYLDMPVDPIGLSEALPFLVITVGFDKPLQLARAVFQHPNFLLAAVPASQVVADAISKSGTNVFRDYAIEIAVLCLGAWSGISGLKEFCALAALILAVDAVAIFTLYVAVLNVMVEVSLRKFIGWVILTFFAGQAHQADTYRSLHSPLSHYFKFPVGLVENTYSWPEGLRHTSQQDNPQDTKPPHTT
jgi:hypothetical protein